MKQMGLRKWLPLLVLALALFISVLDSTIITISVRAIVGDLHTTLKMVQWIITGYSLVVGAFMLTGGRLGDIFGRKRMFLLGAIIFGIGSIFASQSHTARSLLVSVSLIEGLGAALMTPCTAALIAAEYRGKDRAIAFGVYGAVAGAAATAGPIIGGFLTTNYSWRWNYLINPAVVVVLLLGSVVLHETQDRHAYWPDMLSIILSALGLGGVVYGIIESSTYGWIRAKAPYELFNHLYHFHGVSISPYSILIGLGLIGIFLWRQMNLERRGKPPLVSLVLFRNVQFVASICVVGLIALTQFGLIFALPVFYEGLLGKDALHTGLAVLPLTLSMLVSAPIAGILVGKEKATPKQVTQFGLVVMLLGTFFLYKELGVHSTIWTPMPGMTLFGLGFGCGFSQLSNLALSSVSTRQAGEASGVNNTFRLIGTSLGQALVGALLISALTTRLTGDIANSRTLPQAAKPQITASAITAAESLGTVTASRQHNAEITNAITRIKNDAIAHSAQMGIVGTGIAGAVALVASTRLPRHAMESDEE